MEECRANVKVVMAFSPALVIIVTILSAPVSAPLPAVTALSPWCQAACLVLIKSTEFQLLTRKQSKWLADSGNQAP